MKLEMGKTYVTSVGRKATVIDINPDAHPNYQVAIRFCDELHAVSSRGLDGRWKADRASCNDLIAEYKEPETIKTFIYVGVYRGYLTNRLFFSKPEYSQDAAMDDCVSSGDFRTILKIPVEYTDRFKPTDVGNC